MSVLLQRQPARGAVIRVLQPELELVLHIASGARRRAAAPRAGAPSRLARRTRAAEERLEEIRERVRVAEHLPHLVFGHRAEAAAAAARVDVPAAAGELARIEAAEAAGPGRGAGLLVCAPVGAELVVLAALLRIAEDFVRLVDLFELPLGGLVAR